MNTQDLVCPSCQSVVADGVSCPSCAAKYGAQPAVPAPAVSPVAVDGEDRFSAMDRVREELRLAVFARDEAEAELRAARDAAAFAQQDIARLTDELNALECLPAVGA